VAEPDWIDEELDFGANRIGEGRAFAWSDREVSQLRRYHPDPDVRIEHSLKQATLGGPWNPAAP